MKAKAEVTISKKPFGTVGGKSVELYSLSNPKGMALSIATYGGIIVSLLVPDKSGRFADVVLGHETLGGYLTASPFFGCIVGRYANRIGGARFTLEGKEYRLAANDGANCLHGGKKGFDKAVWLAREVRKPGAAGVELAYRSGDGEEGFPGTLDVTVTYWLDTGNQLSMEYAAVTDRTTIVNLTNHAYWNLAGEGNGDILGHVVTINANRYTPVAAGLIPTGELAPVAGTPMDFTKPHAVGERIGADFEQLKLGGGYDHNWVINRQKPEGLATAATVHEPVSGRFMEVLTTEPGVQFYTGNFLDGTIEGKSGRSYGRRSALCLETQHFPDSPNKPAFPSVVLAPGHRYSSTTVHKFSVR